MFLCVRVLKDGIERSEARLNRMELGSIPHVLRGQAEDKRRYSREAKTEVHSSQSGWQPRNSAILQTKTFLASGPPLVMPALLIYTKPPRL
jgi:hypothetical protein